ncbi:MAG: hypothetical protein IKA22_12890 [Lentisphaeria bacterium]|nr:hypothetical protein [Lentisphaeria bacterium]
MANPAEDLIAHSSKKKDEQSNIPPKNSPTPHSRQHSRLLVHHSLWQRWMPLTKRGWTSPCGVSGGAVSPPEKNIATFSPQLEQSVYEKGFFICCISVIFFL